MPFREDDAQGETIRREDGIDLLDFFTTLLKRWRLVLGMTLAAFVIAVAIALLLPPVYRAETRILPPRQDSAGAAAQFLSQLGGPFGGLLGASLGMKTPADLYADMLTSRTVLDHVVDRFDLVSVYGGRYREDARKRLLRRTRVRLDKKSEIITIFVEDRDPKRSAELANAFVEALKDMSGTLAVTDAARRRLFFEERLQTVKADLAVAEDAVRGFQEETGALEISAQAKAVIEGIASLRAQIVAREIQAQVMRAYATSENPDLQRIEEEVKGLRTALARLERKGTGTSGADPLMPAGRLPAVGTEYLRRMRDLKYNEALFEVLAQQYEMAKLDEARDPAVIQVIDQALPPERKAKPKRTLIAAGGALAGLVLSLFAAYFSEFFERVSGDPANRRRFETLRRHARL
jgi:tyrosine-protein kinase Etk/Wzc